MYNAPNKKPSWYVSIEDNVPSVAEQIRQCKISQCLYHAKKWGDEMKTHINAITENAKSNND